MKKNSIYRRYGYDPSPRRGAALQCPRRAVALLSPRRHCCSAHPKNGGDLIFFHYVHIYIQLWLVRVVRYIGRMRKDTQTEKAHARGLYTYICIMNFLKL